MRLAGGEIPQLHKFNAWFLILSLFFYLTEHVSAVCPL